MSAVEDVAAHIRLSLMDLRRRLDGETAIEIARAVMLGASQAVRELSDTEITADPVGPSGMKEGAQLFMLEVLKH